MTKIGNFINKQKEKLVQLLPYNAIINPVTKKPLNEEIVTSREAGTGGAPSLPFVPEAPVDGKQYARQDGAWSEVQGGRSDWKCVFDGVLPYNSFQLDEMEDGTPINAQEVLIQILIPRGGTINKQMYAWINSLSNKNRAEYGYIYNDYVNENSDMMTEVHIYAGKGIYAYADIVDYAELAVAKRKPVNKSYAGVSKTPQIYNEIVTIGFVYNNPLNRDITAKIYVR